MDESDWFFPATEQLFFQLYFSDTIEAIGVVKNYLDDDKNGMSCSCIIVYDNSKNDNNNNFKIYNNNNNNNDNNNNNAIHSRKKWWSQRKNV